MATQVTHPVLEAALEAGRNLGLDLRVIGKPARNLDPTPDAWVRLRYEDQCWDHPVILRPGVTPSTAGSILHTVRTWGKGALLVTSHVTSPLAELLRSEGLAFLDAAGNAFLDHPPLLVWVKGERRKTERIRNEPLGLAFQPRGLQVLFALLCNPALADRPYREIAGKADVAHGTVGWVMNDLRGLGFIMELGGARRLMEAPRLLTRWAEAYAQTLRPRLLLDRFRSDSLDWAHPGNFIGKDLLLGGEPAADAFTHYLRPGMATLYGRTMDNRFLLAHRLRRDPEGNVELRRRFWAFESEEPGLVPMILVYADLLATGAPRCIETAGLLQERIHARFV